MTAEQRLKAIAEVIRDRGFYAMSPTDGAALEALISQATGQPQVPYDPRLKPAVMPAKPTREELIDILDALAAAGWKLTQPRKAKGGPRQSQSVSRTSRISA